MGDFMIDRVRAGGLYLFLKSGNWVRAVKHIKDGFWQVERTDTGKAMLAPERALVANPEEHGIEVCASTDPREKVKNDG
jgi:hypothetical protein